MVILFTLCVVQSKAQTKFGVLVNGRMSLNTKVNIARQLGVIYIRDAVTMQAWKGFDESTDKYLAAGFKIILNINWGQVQQPNGTRSPVPYPTDTIEYKKILNQMLDKYQPELVVIENEETVKKYHNGPIEDYINELAAAINVAHGRGLKITNGGITNRELVLLVYNDYLEKGMKKEANDFAGRCLKTSLLKGQNEEAKNILDKAKKLIDVYKKLPLDYVNIHIYEPIKNEEGGTDESVTQITPNAIQEMISYVERATGKKVISNESGERTSSPQVVTQMLNEFAKAKLDYLVWFSGDGEGGSRALQNPDGSLRENGEAFRSFTKAYTK